MKFKKNDFRRSFLEIPEMEKNRQVYSEKY